MNQIPLTLGACAQAEPVLAKFARLSAPPKVAYHVAKLLRLVRVEAAHFHEKREALIKELGDRRPSTDIERARGMDAEIVQVPAAKVPEFLKRLDEEGAVEVVIAWAPLTVGEVETLPAICADDLLALGALLADEAVEPQSPGA